MQISLNNQFYNFADAKTNSPAMEIEYGITKNLQIGIGGNFETFYPKNTQNYTTRNYTNYAAELGLLLSIINNKHFAISAILETGIVTDNYIENHAETEIEYEPSLVFAKQLNKFQTHISCGAQIGQEIEIAYNLAMLYPYKMIVTTLEINGIIETENTILITPGITCKPTDFMELGLGIPYNISNQNPIFGLIFGITFELGD